MKLQYLLSIILFLPIIDFGQTQDNIKSKNEFSAGINYQSNLHYFGRTDSLQSSALLPNIGFQSKIGLYVQSNFVFVKNSQIPETYAGTTVEGGYRFKQTKHFNGNIFYTQIFYKDKSLLPQSALKSQTGINVAYTNNIVNVNGGADLKFSNDKTDIGATLGFDHIFIFHKQNSRVAFAADPSAYMYAGTQNFTKAYLEEKSLLGVPISQQQATENYNAFNILSYEISVPLVIVAGKFNASITPSYVMPQNLLQGEKGSNMLYVIVSVGVKL